MTFLVTGPSAVLTIHDIGRAGWKVIASARLTEVDWEYELGERVGGV